VYVGFLTRKWIHDTSDFILAGREVSIALNIFGVAAIGVAGTAISVVPGFAVLYGFWSSYLNQLIFCIGGLSLYGVFFTSSTTPDISSQGTWRKSPSTPSRPSSTSMCSEWCG